MFTHPKIHFIITYNPSHKKSIKEYLAGFGDIFSKRRLLYSNMPLFTEREVKEDHPEMRPEDVFRNIANELVRERLKKSL